MIDIDAAITGELERMVPVFAEPDWNAVKRSAGLDHRRFHVLRARRHLVAVAVAALILTGAALAAVREIPWWQSGQPPIDPQAVAALARDNMPASIDTTRARTVVEDGNAALVAVSLGTSGYCLIPTLAAHGNLGAQCKYQVIHPQTGDDDLTVSLARPAAPGSPPEWLLYGRITDPRAAKLDLGPLTIPLNTGGFFLTRLPESQWATLGGTANSGRVLDVKAHTLRSGCVTWGPSPQGKGTIQPVETPLFDRPEDGCTQQMALPPPALNLSRAEKLVEFTLVHDFSIWKAGTQIAIWTAPAQDRTVCHWIGLAAAPPTTSHALPSGPGACGPPSQQPANHQQSPFAQLTISVGGGGLITGQIDTKSHVAKVALETGSDTTVLPLKHGWFIGQLPQGSHPGEMPPGGPFILVAYHADGSIITRSNIHNFLQQATPH